MAVIGIMDSGSGGLSVYREIRRRLPEARFIYYADNANCPYGEKSPEFITGRCRAISRFCIEGGADAMVIACNTATAASISTLRQEFSIPFVGMEPAVKPAALGTRSGVIGVLATAGTLKASKYLNTRDAYSDDVTVVEHIGKGFVELVENGDLCSPHARETVSASLTPLLEAGADTIVLGCTHYPFLLPIMQDIAGEDIQFIDPAPAVARQVCKILDLSGTGYSDSYPGTDLLTSGPEDSVRRIFNILDCPGDRYSISSKAL